MTNGAPFVRSHIQGYDAINDQVIFGSQSQQHAPEASTGVVASHLRGKAKEVSQNHRSATKFERAERGNASFAPSGLRLQVYDLLCANLAKQRAQMH